MYGFGLSEKIKNELGVKMSLNAFCLFVHMNASIEVCESMSLNYISEMSFSSLSIEDSLIYLKEKLNIDDNYNLKIPWSYLEASPFAKHGLDIKLSLFELRDKGLIYIESDYIILRYINMKGTIDKVVNNYEKRIKDKENFNNFVNRIEALSGEDKISTKLKVIFRPKFFGDLKMQELYLSLITKLDFNDHEIKNNLINILKVNSKRLKND